MLKGLGAGLLIVSAVLILPMAFGLALSESFYQSKGLLNEALAVSTIAASGAALRHFSQLGVRRQLQIDSVEGEVRLGYLDAHRQFREMACFPQSDIQSAFLLRSKSTNKPARLAFRLSSAPHPLVVFKCTEAELIPVLNEITIWANKTSNNRLRRTTTERMIQVEFG